MYKTIIFDLDDTLTDDFENTKEAFKILMDYTNEEFKEENFLRFYKIDKKLWSDRSEGKIITPFEDDIKKKAEWLRASRFIKYYENRNKFIFFQPVYKRRQNNSNRHHSSCKRNWFGNNENLGGIIRNV